MDDAAYMARCLALAARGAGRTSPNPMVGAVVVKGGRVVGQGFHLCPGTPHAEIHALRLAGRRARGATLYVNLEPCGHTDKRTPPCADAVLASGVRRVVIAMRDPNPKVSGRGIRLLRRAGIRVDVGLLRADAEMLNVAFVKHMTTGLPFTILKLGQSLDGKIATARGESKWITGEASRERVASLRDAVSAVMVGVGTVERDDPRLTARVGRGRGKNPVRIVLDGSLRISPRARLLRSAFMARTIIATTAGAPKQKMARLATRGAEIWLIPSSRGRIDLRALARRIGREGLNTLLIEGGSEVAASALHDGIVDRVIVFIAPRIIGGRDAVSSIGGRSPRRLRDALRLEVRKVETRGEDLMVIADVGGRSVRKGRR